MSGLAVKIKNVRIQNFKSIEDLSIRLNEGLNIFIGDNGAGKSNFLEFIDNMVLDLIALPYVSASDNMTYELDLEYKYRGDIYLLQLTSSSQKGRSISDYRRIFKYSKYKNGKSIFRDLEAVADGDASQTPGLDQLIAEIKKVGFPDYGVDFITFNLPEEIDYISAPGKFIVQHETGNITEDNPGYVSSLFMYINFEVQEKFEGLQIQKASQERLKTILFELFAQKKRENKYVQLLKKYTPISDLQLNGNINIYKTNNSTIVDNFVLNFKVKGHWLPWSFLSDGTKRLFHIVTEIVLGDNDIVLIEEPELGVHPDQLHLLMNFLKEQAEKKQILLSSHSPIALDILNTNELDNIIITKLTNRGTKMYHLNQVQLSKANAYIKKVGKLSDYWLHSDLEK